MSRNVKQHGQSSVLGIALLAMLIAGLFTLYNTGQVTTEKTRLVNAVDAAAYSSGVQVARNLNYVAYANRAMIANHVAVGHMTSYVSWINYVQDTIDTLEDYLFWIPYVGQALTYVDNFMSYYKDFNDYASEIVAIGMQSMNTAIYATQLDAEVAMSLPALQMLQDDVFSAYQEDGAIDRVGLTDFPDALTSSLDFGRARVKQLAEQQELLSYMEFFGYEPGDDEDVMEDMIGETLSFVRTQSPRRWMYRNNARNWRETVFPFRVEKSGTTRGIYDQGEFGWAASDSLRVRRWGCSLSGCRYRTRVTNTERATSEDWDYNGIYRYISIEDHSPNQKVAHSATVVGSYNLTGARLFSPGTGDHAQAGNELYAISCAEVYFSRPTDLSSFGSNREEYSNVFNPFWKVRLRGLGDCGDET